MVDKLVYDALIYYSIYSPLQNWQVDIKCAEGQGTQLSGKSSDSDEVSLHVGQC